MSNIKASIVINTKNRASRLYIVLKALECQVDDGIEIIVVFDGCTTKTLETFSQFKFSFPIKEIVSHQNVGRAAARNLGIRGAGGEIIILIDDDRVPGEDFVNRHLEGHDKNSIFLGNRRDVHLEESEIDDMNRSGNSLNEFLKNLKSKSKVAFDSHDTLLRRLLFFKMNPIIWILFYTGNVSLHRSQFEKAGFFDENFKGWGYEDLEMGYRLYKEKYKLIKCKSIVNYHLTHEISVSDMADEAVRNLKYFSKKVRRDILAKLVIFMLTVPLYVRIFQRYVIRSSVLKKQSDQY